MISLGIDVGGSGIKYALVDTLTGSLVSERKRIETPKNGKVSPIIKAISRFCQGLDWDGPIGIAFPAVVKDGSVRTATNIDEAWIGKDLATMVLESTNNPCIVLNDADAAGKAEMEFGVGKGVMGTVIVLTIGTGIGSAIFSDGMLISNTEFGHLKFKGGIAEAYTSDAVRKKLDMKWSEWALRFNEYLKYLEMLFWPNLIIVGGGVSKKFEKFSHQLSLKSKVVPAKLLNDAGIIGAATAAIELQKTSILNNGTITVSSQ